MRWPDLDERGWLAAWLKPKTKIWPHAPTDGSLMGTNMPHIWNSTDKYRNIFDNQTSNIAICQIFKQANSKYWIGKTDPCCCVFEKQLNLFIIYKNIETPLVVCRLNELLIVASPPDQPGVFLFSKKQPQPSPRGNCLALHSLKRTRWTISESSIVGSGWVLPLRQRSHLERGWNIRRGKSGFPIWSQRRGTRLFVSK